MITKIVEKLQGEEKTFILNGEKVTVQVGIFGIGVTDKNGKELTGGEVYGWDLTKFFTEKGTWKLNEYEIEEMLTTLYGK